MKLKKLTIRWCLFILIITMSVDLFPGSASPAETLRIGINEFPAALNPVYASTETSQAIMNKIFNGLFYFDEKGNIQKELVEKVHIKNNDNDKRTRTAPKTENTVEIVIELKKNIFFADGKKLTADDVVATVELLQDRRFQYPYISNLQFIQRIEKLDRHRLKITMPYRFAPWQAYLTFKILNSHEIKNVSPESFRDMILSGTGPYKFKTIKKPTKIILELNHAGTTAGHLASIPGKMPRIIEYQVISYTHLAPLKLINNEIDICELQPENAAAYQQTDSKQWHQSFSLLRYKKFGYTYLVFNLRNSLITRNLRSLFYNLLLDGDFLSRFLKDRGEPVVSPFLLLNSKVKPVRLKAAPLETPIRLNILTNSESKLRKQLILFLREELKPFNIHLQPVFLEYHTFLEYLKKGQYDIGVSAFILDIDYDMTDIFSSDSYFNYAHFSCPGMDELLQQGLRELDPGKREEIYLKAHRLWLENLPLIPLFNLYYYVGVSRHIVIPARRVEIVGSVGDFLYNILEWRKKELHLPPR
jgi:peptide/nickel transport system substrate-binding protein